MTAIQAMMSPLHRHWALYKKSRSGNGSGLDSVLALVWPDGEELLQVNWTVTFWGAYLQCIAIFVFTGYVQLCEDLVLTAIQLLFCVLAYVRVRVN